MVNDCKKIIVMERDFMPPPSLEVLQHCTPGFLLSTCTLRNAAYIEITVMSATVLVCDGKLLA